VPLVFLEPENGAKLQMMMAIHKSKPTSCFTNIDYCIEIIIFGTFWLFLYLVSNLETIKLRDSCVEIAKIGSILKMTPISKFSLLKSVKHTVASDKDKDFYVR
jgi:hypothetical protein